jgi:hypothetical protein
MIHTLKFIIKEFIFKLNDFKSRDLSFDSKKENELRKNGFFIIKNFIPDKECDALKADIDSHSTKEYCWRDKYDSDIRIFGIENLEVKFLNIFNRHNLLNIYKKYISIDKLYQTVMAAKMNFTTENLGSGGGWHRDTTNQRQLKFILYLSDVDDDNGCFQYITSSHKLRKKIKSKSVLNSSIVKQRYTNDDAMLISQKLGLKLKSFVGQKGTLIVADTSGIHRGKPMKSGIRYAITNYMSEKPFGASITDLIVSQKHRNINN